MAKNVFEDESTFKLWDDDYYHPIALQFYDRAVKDMLTYMRVQPGDKILDAGCGPGVHSIRIAKLGHSLNAIDLSETMLGQATKRAEIENVSDKIEFDQGDLTKLSIDDDAYDCVFSWGVIIHIENIEDALDELARIVKPGGKLALYITNKTALDHMIEGFFRLISGKPLAIKKQSDLGEGITYESNGLDLWLWRLDNQGVVDYLSRKGYTLVKKQTGEMTEHQRRLSGIPRKLLLHLNNFAYRFNFLSRWATANLLVFEKRG